MISSHHYTPIRTDWRETLFSQLSPNYKAMSVYLVDEAVIMRDRLKRMLADVPGVQVIGETGNAQDASAAIPKQNPDVVILDIQLQSGSGIDVLQSLKKTKPAPAVIILTNNPYPQYRQKCLEAGADFFFVKFTEFDQVVPALKQLMQRARNAGARLPTE